jgi:hypothetical protein
MIDWFSTACCLYGARSKYENTPYDTAVKSASNLLVGGGLPDAVLDLFVQARGNGGVLCP